MVETPTERLSKRRLFAYSLIEFPMQMAYIPMAIFIPAFYTRDLGLSLAATGTILMIGRIADVFSDPLIGYLSDRVHTRFGRRKPWIVAGAPIMMASIYMLFIPERPISNGYFALWTISLWFGWTLINIPYYAWGAELSSDYHERTRTTTWRTATGIAGTLVTIGYPLIAWQLSGYGAALDESLNLTAHAALIAIAVAVIVLVISVPEGTTRPTGPIAFRKGLRVMWGNGPFKRLLLGFILNGIATSIPGPLYILYVIHVIGADVAANLILLLFYAGMFVGVGFWGWLASQIGKRNSWLTGMCALMLVHPWYMALGPGDIEVMLVLLFFGGFCGGIWAALPASMKADVVDIDRLESGDDRTGLFFSTWSFATKLIPAFSVGIVFQALEFAGFQASGINGADQILALKLIFGGIPALFWALAIVTIWRYPITEASHRQLQQTLHS